MSVDRILALKLVGDVSSINKSMKQTQGRMRSFASSAGSWVKAAGIGLAIEGVAKLGDALGDAWSGFREGEKAAGQLGTTWDNLNVRGADLDKTIADIGAMALKLGTDDTEAIQAFNVALQNTGGKPTQAMNRLRIAQDLVANGSAPNLQSAMKLIDRAASGSAATVRKFGLTSDTAAGRVKELGEKVKGAAAKAAAMDPIRVALNGIGEGLETVVGALSEGDIEGALGGIRDIGSALSEAWSDVFPAVDKAMAKLLGAEDWENVKGLVQGFLDKTKEVFDKVLAIWDKLAPHIENVKTLTQPLIDGISATIGLFAENVGLALDGIIALLNGDFTGAWDAIEGIVENAKTAVETQVNAIKTFIEGIIPGIQAGAQGIGDAIFDGIKGGIDTLASTVRKIMNDAVEALRSAWNSLDFAIPAFNLKWDGISVPNPAHGTVFDVFGTPNVSVLGAGNFNVWQGTGDLIPDLAQGGIIRKRPGGMLARIGEGSHDEAVIPLDGRGMGGGNTYNINVRVETGADPVSVGRRIVDAIEAYERRAGKRWRTA